MLGDDRKPWLVNARIYLKPADELPKTGQIILSIGAYTWRYAVTVRTFKWCTKAEVESFL